MNDNLRTLVRRPWRDLALPPDATGIPTMLSKLERRLLYSLARDYAGEGAIVDAGSFLGGSTAALLAGVRDRPETWTGPPVASYDLFEVDEYMVPKFFADERSLQPGDSFRARFDAHVARFDVPHVVREGDITRLGWAGGPIDVLFLDVLKSWEINDAVLRDFFPSLVPGRSVIVHQDYGWGDTPWIPITVELMRESLVLLDWMEWGTHVFFVAEELPPDLLARGVADLDLDTKVQLLEHAARHAEGWVLGMLEISRALLIADRDGRDAALAELEAIRARNSQRGFVLACAAQVSASLAGVVPAR
ncbi:MAG: hypothetical protein ACJ74D_12065 [Gaiellaceae bacterium]